MVCNRTKRSSRQITSVLDTFGRTSDRRDAKIMARLQRPLSVPWGSLSLISSSVLVLSANSLITNRSFVRLLSSISSRTMFASTY